MVPAQPAEPKIVEQPVEQKREPVQRQEQPRPRPKQRVKRRDRGMEL